VKHKFINDGRCSEIVITLRPAMLYEFVSSSHEKIGKAEMAPLLDTNSGANKRSFSNSTIPSPWPTTLHCVDNLPRPILE
jgi:hypothetical protein